jgi:hypothetical protein
MWRMIDVGENSTTRVGEHPTWIRVATPCNQRRANEAQPWVAPCHALRASERGGAPNPNMSQHHGPTQPRVHE